MAKGRMIVNAIVADKDINGLSDDTSRLAFTWLVTFADVDGRTYGDPAMVRSMLFPRREDVTAARMEQYIREWAEAGLIVWYEAKGDKWIWFPGFDKNQTGLDRRKESPSRIPAPPQAQHEDARATETHEEVSVPSTEQVQSEYRINKENRREEKRKEDEVKGTGDDFGGGRSESIQAWEQVCGTLNPMDVDMIKTMSREAEEHRAALQPKTAGADRAGDDWVAEAIREANASKTTPRVSLKFVRAILERWYSDGFRAKRPTGPPGRPGSTSYTGGDGRLHIVVNEGGQM